MEKNSRNQDEEIQGDQVYAKAPSLQFRRLFLRKLKNILWKSFALRLFLRLLFSKFNLKVAFKDSVLPIFRFALSTTLFNLFFQLIRRLIA